jgi:outer membrane protein assembly factor BamB
MESDQSASPAVVGGVAYAVSESPGQLRAFDAAGAVGCTGTPKVCNPLWTAGQTYDPVKHTWVGDDLYSSPVVANGVVYVQGTSALFAYDAAGKRNCAGTPRVCAPLWRTHDSGIFTPAAPVVANGFVYAGLGNGEIGAYDARGATGCGGTPKTCSPQRILLRQGTNMISSPAIVNGVLYVGGDVLSAYDVSSTAHCTGTPLTCMPIWTASTGAYIGASPSIANGVVYVGSYNTNFYAFDAAGLRNCGGAPKVCSPLWFANTGPGQYVESPAAIANGVVYVGAEDGTLLAFDAAGQTGCNAGQCLPIWSVATGQSFVTSGAAVVDGTVYWTGADSVLRAYRLGS